MGDKKPYYYLSTVAKAMTVLEQFITAGPELGVSDIARRTNMHKSVTHRILATLSDLDFLAKGSTEGTYRLGVKSLEIGLSYLHHSPLERVAQIHQQRLIQQLPDMASHVAILDGTGIVYQKSIVGPQADYHTRSTVGRRQQAYCNSLGKVLLAYLSPSELRAYLSKVELRPFTSNTITSPERLSKELQQIRSQEWAFDNRENFADRCCVAAPIRDHNSRVVASLSVAGVPECIDNYGLDSIAAKVKETAWAISREMGYSP